MDSLTVVRMTQRGETHAEFGRRVRAQSDALRKSIAGGRFGGGFVVGLELEGYAVDEDGRLAPVPDSAFGSLCEPELGRHNAEVNTPATAFDPDGLSDQDSALSSRMSAVRGALADVGRRFVIDGMWTIPPPPGTIAYLSDARDENGVIVPTNMSPHSRYYSLNADITADGPVTLAVPGCRRAFPTILVESLSTSMQVHLQVPTTDFPRYFNAALRTTGPVLALATNSPFLPPDLYTDADPTVVLDGVEELRVPVFESMNVGDSRPVRLPRDIDSPVDVLDRLVADRQCAPYLREWVTDGPREGFAGEHWELLHKQGTAWRWIRPVFGPSGLRLEYRLLSAQPSVPDVVGFQALIVGLLHGLAETDHPLPTLPWNVARRSLYSVVRDGLDGELAWLTRDGDRTADPAIVYEELFSIAREGLRRRGLTDSRIDDRLAPIESRWSRRTTPSRWKRRRVRDRLDAGSSLESAITGMQREYVRRCRADEPFVAWPG